MKSFRFLLASLVILTLFACGGSADQQNSDDAATKQASSPVAETPAPTPEAPAPNPAPIVVDSMARLVQLTLNEEMKADIEKDLIDSASRIFKYAEHDLNADGKKEIFVGMTGPYFCGSGGCSMYLLDYQGNVITRFSVANYPVIIGDTKTKGWSDLIIESAGNRLVKFDGRKYPSNPSTQPKYSKTPTEALARVLVWESLPSLTF
jgi:hypothetical protein